MQYTYELCDNTESYCIFVFPVVVWERPPQNYSKLFRQVKVQSKRFQFEEFISIPRPFIMK